MSKNQEKRSPGPGPGLPNSVPGTDYGKSQPPAKATVLEWVRKDLQSAHYLLGVILLRHPEIVEEVAETVYETIMRKENGSAINHESDGPSN